jgi:hypothetical protein
MTTHAFSNGTSAQLTIELGEDLHAYVGGSLRLVATKEEVSVFLHDLENWAARVFPDESQGTNGPSVMSTPEPSAAPVVPDPLESALPAEHRPELVDDITSAIELVLSIIAQGAPTVGEIRAAVSAVSPGLVAEAIKRAEELVPPELKPVFDLIKTL